MRYVLTVTSSNTGTTAILEPNLTTTNWTAPASLPDGPYRWWVYGVNARGLSTLASVPQDLFVGGRTELLSPVGASTESMPVFSWRPVTGAVRFKLWVNRVDVPAAVLRESILGQTTFSPATALPAGTCRAWIQAVSESGELSPWSVASDFEILSLALPSLRLPSP